MNEDGLIEEAMLELCGTTDMWTFINACKVWKKFWDDHMPVKFPPKDCNLPSIAFISFNNFFASLLDLL